MQARAMRTIDFWVGLPVCWLLTQFERVCRVFSFGRAPVSAPGKILFVKLEEQGALVVACPAVELAERMVGRDNVYFATFDQNRPILELMDLVRPGNILCIRNSNPWEVIIDTIKVIIKIRMLRIDATIDMEFFARGSAALTYLCGSRRRVGLHGFNAGGPYRGDLMTHRVLYNPYLHTADAYAVLVKALSSDPSETPLLKVPVSRRLDEVRQFQPPDTSMLKVRGALQARFGNGIPSPLFIFHPNVTDALRVRKWPQENYIALARHLLERYPDAGIFMTGLTGETDVIGDLVEQCGGKRVHSLSGELSLADLLTLLGMADVLVTNDSGPAHFAALTRVHTVALYGPETPTLFGPLGPRNRVLHRPFACSPCLTAFNYRLSPCENNLCVKSITVDDVLAAVDECLKERAAC